MTFVQEQTPRPSNEEIFIPFTPDLLNELQLNLSHKDQIISQLAEKVQQMEVKLLSNSKPTKETSNESKKAPRKSSDKSNSNCRTSAKKSKRNSQNKSTNRKQLDTMHCESRARKNPLQMLQVDHPTGFEHTKKSFYMHIKLLWDLMIKGSVPVAPDPNHLQQFYQCFSKSSQIESAIDSDGPTLIPIHAIKTLRESQEQCTNI
ncbi:hypothetical protein O181_090182 [Austropuccinia psidii MF-1]|uniref:Uncharacterized protein n=1 Tax=Austropuccinia psidii MF-1 TaxID=1389203 RepID=A0A9Q3IUV9_9BASI|nr:hypothetical protein [Austropuccinia psidii MF-1]